MTIYNVAYLTRNHRVFWVNIKAANKDEVIEFFKRHFDGMQMLMVTPLRHHLLTRPR